MIPFSVITSVLITVQKCYSTLWKALDIGYKSLENNHTINHILKNLKMQFYFVYVFLSFLSIILGIFPI